MSPVESRTIIRNRAATLALGATIILTLVKIGVAILSHSVGVLSEAIHSFLDVVSAAVAYFTIREAGKKADQDHPYGHGKFETLSSLLESMLLMAAAVLIVHESLDHFRNPKVISYPWLGIMTMAISMVLSAGMYKNNASAARIADSSAIMGNALHFLADVVAAAGILVGLVVIYITGWLWVDPLLGVLVAIYIIAISVKQVKTSLLELLDTTLPEAEIKVLERTIDSFKPHIIDAHDLRTRKSGSTRHVDFHLSICEHTTVKESHDICDQIEEKIQDEFPQSSVNIHVEPCEHRSENCKDSCETYKKMIASRLNELKK